MTIVDIVIGIIALRIVLGSRSDTPAALVTIVAGVALCDAVGGGWFGWLLAGLLFLVVAILRHPRSLAHNIGITPRVTGSDPLLTDREIARLAAAFPEWDWATARTEIAKARRTLASFQDKAGTQANGADSLDDSTRRR